MITSFIVKVEMGVEIDPGRNEIQMMMEEVDPGRKEIQMMMEEEEDRGRKEIPMMMEEEEVDHGRKETQITGDKMMVRGSTEENRNLELGMEISLDMENILEGVLKKKENLFRMMMTVEQVCCLFILCSK